MQQRAGLLDAVGGVDDDDGVRLRLEVHNAGAGAEHRFDQFLDLLHVGGAEVAELIVKLGARQLRELGLGERVDGVALGMEGEPIHKGQFFHLLERVAVVEVTGDEELGTGDLGIVEILAAGRFRKELEDVIQPGVLNDEALVSLRHLLLLLLERAEWGRRAGDGFRCFDGLYRGWRIRRGRQAGWNSGGWHQAGSFRDGGDLVLCGSHRLDQGIDRYLRVEQARRKDGGGKDDKG